MGVPLGIARIPQTHVGAKHALSEAKAALTRSLTPGSIAKRRLTNAPSSWVERLTNRHHAAGPAPQSRPVNPSSCAYGARSALAPSAASWRTPLRSKTSD